MGSLTTPLPQGPNTHCGKEGKHEPHPNPNHMYQNAWCDGVPLLPSFVELTIRVPLEAWSMQAASHKEAKEFIGREGLMAVVAAIGEPSVVMALRIRTGGEDLMYPIIKRNTGLTAVEMPDEPGE